MGRKPKDISDMPLLSALRMNPRRLNMRDMQTMLKEAADRIEELEGCCRSHGFEPPLYEREPADAAE